MIATSVTITSSASGNTAPTYIRPPRTRDCIVAKSGHQVHASISREEPLFSGRWIVPLLAGLCAIALVVRWRASGLPFADDEASTLLAAQRIAETGLPVLPSGVLYLHGATISYLLAPLAWFGWLDIDHLHQLRLVNVMIGTITVPVIWLLARRASGSGGVGLLAALLFAVDPTSALWGSYLRMYALLALLALVVALAFMRAIEAPPGNGERRALVVMVVAFWLAVFSQMVAALMLPALVLVSFALFGRELLGVRRRLTAALALCALAVVTYVGLGRLAGAGGASAGEAGTSGSIGIVGDHLLLLSRLFEPNLVTLQQLFGGVPFGQALPYIVALLSGVVAGRWLVGSIEPANSRGRAAGALLALGWMPVVGLAFLLAAAGERYLMVALGALLTLVAWGARLLWPDPATNPRWSSGWWVRVGMAALPVALFLGRDLVMTRDFAAWGPRFGGQLAALEAVKGELGDEDLVITTFPPAIAYHGLDGHPGVRFLNVSRLYNGPSPDGTPRDFWLGHPMLTTRAALCGDLASNPGAFVLFSQNAMRGKQDASMVGEKAPELIDLVAAASEPYYEDDRVATFRVMPVSDWSREAFDTCPRARSPKLEEGDGTKPSAPARNRPNREKRAATPSP
jgi:hypothetical protein